MNDDYDTPWKEAMDGYFEAFLAFFLPEAHAEIDWRRDYEPLDTELRELTPGAVQGRRLIDKLMKVFTIHDDEALLHTEVQVYPEVGFDRRLFSYNVWM